MNAKLEELKARETAILNNRDLSKAGQDKQIAALKTEKRAAIEAEARTLRRQAIEAAINAKKTGGAAWALNQLEAEKLDYGRLTYEAQAVKSALVLAGDDPEKVKNLWARAKASQDKYVIRAWLDTAPAAIPAEGKGSDPFSWNELKADFAQSVEIAESAEMARYKGEQKAHLEALTAIHRQAEELSQELGTERGILPYVFDGIAKDRETGELNIDFRQQENESLEQTQNRLEVEFQERANHQAEVFKKFGKEYDPLVDGIG